jgi:hypothetical protein
MGVCLQALLRLEVEQLQRPPLRLESNDRFRQMHDCTVSSNRPPDDIVCVLEVDNDCLGGRSGIVVLLADTDILVRLESLSL